MSDIRGYDVHYINKLEAEIERLRKQIIALEVDGGQIQNDVVATNQQLRAENKSLRLQREAVAGGASEGLVKAAERIAELESQLKEAEVHWYNEGKRVAKRKALKEGE